MNRARGLVNRAAGLDSRAADPEIALRGPETVIRGRETRVRVLAARSRVLENAEQSARFLGLSLFPAVPFSFPQMPPAPVGDGVVESQT